jgi:hypothetical protein
MRQLTKSLGNDLLTEGLKLYDKMTQQERARFIRFNVDPQVFRMARIAMLSLIAEGRPDAQFGAESIRLDVLACRRIIRRNR